MTLNAKLKAGAVILLASCTIVSLTTLNTEPPRELAATAGLDYGDSNKDRLLTPDSKPIYVIVYSTDPTHDENFLYNYAVTNTLPEMKLVRGLGATAILGKRAHKMRIQPDPEQLRAHNLSLEDIRRAFRGCSMIGSSERFVKSAKSNELIYFGLYDSPEQYGEIVLKATPDGDILWLMDVAQVELDASVFDISSDIDRHPAVTFVLKPPPGSNSAEVIETVKKRLKLNKKESWPAGMEFSVMQLDGRDMVYACIQTPQDSTLDDTSAKCHEVAAIAKGIDGITSISSLVGYQIRTERRGQNVGTCLIHLKDQSHRKQTSRQIIEKLERKCQTLNVDIEFFEPPAVSRFVAAGGFSVRLLDNTNWNNEGGPAVAPEAFVSDLLKRKKVETLFRLFANEYSQDELVINNTVAREKRVSIANALERRFKVVDSNDPAESKQQRLVEDFSKSSFENDRGEMVPYDSFMELKMMQGLIEMDR